MKPFRFLFFLYYYPPAPGTAPKRNFLISSEISRQVDFFHIITATPQPVLDEKSHAAIEYIEAVDYRMFLRKKTKDGALPESKKKSKGVQTLVRLINTFPFNVAIGEGGMRYFLQLIRRGKQIVVNHSVTHIYSSFRPFTDHYAAYRLKKKYPHLVWIADFRDLIIDPHYLHIMIPGVQHAVFKSIFKEANILTTVSEGLAVHLRKYNSNVVVLKNGIQEIPDKIEVIRTKYFRIVYTGSMFLDKRNAKPIFQAIHELIQEKKIIRDDVKVVYAGKDGELWEEAASAFSLEPILEDKGILTPWESIDLQKNACINVLLTIASDQLQGVLTGKMIEYFEAGNPVLAIVVRQNDEELDHILQEINIGQSFSDQPEDSHSIKNFIHAEYVQWKQTGFNRKPVDLEKLREKYAVENTMKPLWEALG